MERIRLDIDPQEFEALSRLAEDHLRPIPHEARHLVREALREAGLLSSDHRTARPVLAEGVLS